MGEAGADAVRDVIHRILDQYEDDQGSVTYCHADCLEWAVIGAVTAGDEMDAAFEGALLRIIALSKERDRLRAVVEQVEMLHARTCPNGCHGRRCDLRGALTASTSGVTADV